MEPAGPGSGRTARRLAAGIAAFATLALFACGGGSDGGSSADRGGENGGEEPTGVLYGQWGLRTIKADRAYNRLEALPGAGTAPGSGQTRQPGHDDASEPELSLLAGWRRAF